MSKLIKKYLTLDNSANGVNAQVIPANFASPVNYTPAPVASEGTLEISSHLKGIDNALALAKVMEYQGAWDASTNTPVLVDGTGRTGDVYRVSVAGTQNLGSGAQTWAVGDLVIYNGTIWQKLPGTDAVVSVNGATGAVTVNAINQLTGDVTAGPASGSQSQVATLATVNSNVGSFALADITVNAKGLVTAASAASTTGSGAVVLATSPTLVTPALGTPSALVGTNITGTAAGLTAGTVTTNANLTGDVTSVGNATTLATVNANVGSFNLADITVNAKGLITAASAASTTGSGAVVLATSPTLVTPALGTPSALVATNITGIPSLQITTALGFTPENAANLSTDGTMAANSATLFPSQSAVVTYVAAEIAAIPAGAISREDDHTVTGTDITNGYFDLSFAAANAASIQLTPVGGPLQLKAVDYSISLTGGAGGVTRISWTGLGLDGILSSGDVVIVSYMH